MIRGLSKWRRSRRSEPVEAHSSRWSLERSSSASSQPRSSVEAGFTSSSLERLRGSLEKTTTSDDGAHVARLLAKARNNQISILELLDELINLQNVLPPEVHYRMCDFFAEPKHLKYLLLLLTGQVEVEPLENEGELSARERYRHYWLIATLISCGPKELRNPIATDRSLSNILVNFFASKNAHDETITSHVVRVLCSVLNVLPNRFTEHLFAQGDLVPNLVRLIGSPSVADLLVKLISARDFGARHPLVYGPPTKPSILALGEHDIFTLVAARFYEASQSDVKHGVFSADCVQENSVHTVAAMSIRAMMVPGYSNKAGAAHRTELHKRVAYLDLLSRPGPLVEMLDLALRMYEEEDRPGALSATLRAATALLEAVALGRNSSSVAILQQMRQLETTTLQAALCDRLPALQGILLSESLSPCLRVDIVGCFTGLMRVAAKPSATRLAAINVPGTLLDLFFKHRNNDVIQKQVSNALNASMARGGAAELRQSWLIDTCIVRRLSDAWDELAIDDHSNGAAGISHQPSYMGNVLEMVVIIRDAMASSEVRRNELHQAVGEDAATVFLALCDARLPPAERLRRPQVRLPGRPGAHRAQLFPILGSDSDLREGDGDRLYYYNLVETIKAESRGEESAWSPLLEFVGIAKTASSPGPPSSPSAVR